jgi:hypothetical protein
LIKNRISISGKMTSGKTTCSEYLIQKYGYERVSFATPIKQITGWFKEYCKSVPSVSYNEIKLREKNQLFKYLVRLNLDNYVNASKCFDILMEEIFPQYYYMDWTIEKSDEWRKLLQEIGDGLRQKVNPTIWMDYLAASLEEDGLYICDDMRYLNEFEVMRNAGFTLIRLQMSEDIQADRIKELYGTIDPQRLLHPSEIDLDHTAFTYVVDSDQELTKVLHDVVSIAEGS